MLAGQYYSLMDQAWRPVFAQDRSRLRAIAHAMALPCIIGRRTISQTLCTLGRSDRDWSADYKMFSRSRWDSEALFDPVIGDYLTRYPDGPVVAAFDDTKLSKTGKRIPTAFWQRDPMSPPFHVNLAYGLRFIQGSLLFPHYREGDFPARGFPIAFREAPAVKKPGKRASDGELAAFRLARKAQNLSTQTLETIRSLRRRLDDQGAADRVLLSVVDGSFCNRTSFRAELDRIDLAARCRKDARLCFPAPAESRRIYDPHTFTPEQMRQDETVPWKQASVYFGGQWRTLRYKDVPGVLWKRGARDRRLRLIVIAPLPYKLSKHSRINYRDPAYVLTTDLETSGALLLQAYLDRWQIEVNHRDEKEILGVGQAQVRSPQSVPRHPAFSVASYSLLLLSALRTSGPGRTGDYLPLPKWRKHSPRPSLLDILAVLRKEYNETPGWPSIAPNWAQIRVPHANI